MKIVVCLKQTPDTETRVKIGPDGRSVAEGEINWVVNPYDEFAVEEALRIKERLGRGEVVVVSLGPDRTASALRSALAMGADRAVLLKDAAFEAGDPLGAARALAAALQKIGFDLILCGKYGVGEDNAAVPAMVAELLGLPSVSVVNKLELGEGRARCHRVIEGGLEVVETSLPCVISAQKGLNEPRYASLKGIMAAKKKEIAVWGAADIGVGASEVGRAGAAIEWVKVELPAPRSECKIIGGESVQAQVKELVRLLREEAKVI
jgi:electron transfer flavoprotein beta subunit